jgi:hypothetical protein
VTSENISMKHLTLICLLLCVAPLTFAQRHSDVQILESRARRVEEGRVSVDGRVRIGAKPIKGLVLVFDFISADGDPLTSQKVEVDDDVLARGEESTFHAATNNPPGAVRYQLRAFDGADRELRVGNPGPYTIE